MMVDKEAAMLVYHTVTGFVNKYALCEAIKDYAKTENILFYDSAVNIVISKAIREIHYANCFGADDNWSLFLVDYKVNAEVIEAAMRGCGYNETWKNFTVKNMCYAYWIKAKKKNANRKIVISGRGFGVNGIFFTFKGDAEFLKQLKVEAIKQTDGCLIFNQEQVDKLQDKVVVL